MGAHSEIYTYDTQDREEVETRFGRDCPDPAGCYNAEGYCGCPCQFEGRVRWSLSGVYATAEEAGEAILSHHRKWDGEALAAAFPGGTVVGGWVAE